MKKIYLQKITQYNTICYIGKTDPRMLVKIATKVEAGEMQDAQRPLMLKKLKEIAKYSSNSNGILPNTLTIATKDTRLKIHKCDFDNNLFFMEFPENEKEYSDFKDAIDVLDGQHRLYSFLDDYCNMSTDTIYELGFCLYVTPSLDEERRIFISCNEKQQPVNANLLLWFRDKLNMLTDDEKELFSLVSKLNTSYPLKGHIIMGAENIKYGVKSKQVIQAIKKAEINELQYDKNSLNEEQIVKVINAYLIAWENVTGFKFTETSPQLVKKAGPAIKMAGLKYMLYLLPTFWDISLSKEKPFSTEFVESILKKFMTELGVTREDFFTTEDINVWFKDGSGVEKFSKKSISIIKGLDTGSFNPLQNL